MSQCHHLLTPPALKRLTILSFSVFNIAFEVSCVVCLTRNQYRPSHRWCHRSWGDGRSRLHPKRRTCHNRKSKGDRTKEGMMGVTVPSRGLSAVVGQATTTNHILNLLPMLTDVRRRRTDSTNSVPENANTSWRISKIKQAVTI